MGWYPPPHPVFHVGARSVLECSGSLLDTLHSWGFIYCNSNNRVYLVTVTTINMICDSGNWYGIIEDVGVGARSSLIRIEERTSNWGQQG
jgi:hypothetical protein